MKNLIAMIVAILGLLSCGALAQGPGELNAGSQVTDTGTSGAYTLSWWGVAGDTYLIETSDDLVNWSYLPVVESGSNAVIEWGFTSNASNLFLKLEYITVPAVSLSGTLTGPDNNGNGLPDDWELFHYGILGVNPDALAPLENGLTNLQCYQLGINPPTDAGYTISMSVSATGTTATFTVNTSNVPSGTTIQNVSFYQGDSLLGVSTQSPFNFTYYLNNLAPGNYPVRAVSLDSGTETAMATGTLQVLLPATNNTNWWYGRGNAGAGTFTYDSYVVPISLTGGIMPFGSGTNEPTTYQPLALPGSSEGFMALQPWVSGTASPSQSWATGGEPWFLQIATSGTEYHLTGTNGSGPVYSGTESFTNPLVAFGNRTGGTPLYTGQTYTFGVASGGQNLNPTFSGTMNDLKVDVYSASSFTSGTASNVAPITTGTFHLPRPGEPDWETFAQQGYQMPITVPGTTGTNFTINVQYAAFGLGTVAAGANYPIEISVNSSSSAYYLRFSLKGAVPDSNNSANNGWDWMAVDSLSNNSAGDYSVSFTMDFTQQGLQPWQSTIIDRPSFAGATPLPAAYQGMSEADLLNLAPIVTGTDTLPATLSGTLQGAYLQSGTSVATVTSPELVDNPILDSFVSSMNNDPMALANYVQNEIGLVDAMAVPNTGGTFNYTDQSVNFGGVNRGALGVLLEGQGSPVEQCGLLVYLLRKAGVPCAYCFGQLDQMQMVSMQLSQMLRMQLNGAEDYGVTESSSGTTLIPVNYPWVAAYVNGQWVHLFPWIKDTVVQDGYNLYDCLPQGYKTGAEWLRAYLYNDPKIRTKGMEYYEDPGVLFPQFVENNLPQNLSIDDVGVTIWNRPHYYSSWSQFPHPWSRPAVSGSNLYPDLMTYSKAAFSNTDKLFDTASIQVFSDRAGTATTGTAYYVSGDPVVTSGTIYTALLNDRRFLLYHTPAAVSGTIPNTTGTTAWPNYNMNLSLEAIAPMATGTEAFPTILSGTDPYMLNKQFSTTSLTGTDTNLFMVINLTQHRAAETSTGGFAFLDVTENALPTDTRPLRVGDTAAICFNFGQVTHWMLEAQEDKYWSAQQRVQQNPSLPFDIETAQGLPCFLMGMSYFYREGAFINQYQALTKTEIVSSVDHGLAKLSAARISGSATLVNGQLNLRYPNVDMIHANTVLAGNESIQPGSGGAYSDNSQGYVPIFIAASSAQEHLTIQQFFAAENDDAISTIKLMDIASALSLTGTTYTYSDSTYGPLTVIVSSTAGITVTGTSGTLCVTGSGGMIELNNENYRALGQLQLSGTQNGTLVKQSLQTWATNSGIWTSATNAFAPGNNPEFHRVFMTPGPVSGAYSGTGSSIQAAYYGMGALIYGIKDAAALISPNLNGGAGSDDGTQFSFSNSTWIDTTLTDPFASGDDSGASIGLSDFGLGNSVVNTTYLGQETSIANFGDNAANLEDNGGTIAIDPITNWALTDASSLTLGSFGSTSTAAGVVTALQNLQNAGTLQPVFHNNSQTVAEPVNTVTGEFYVDTVDLKMNGPMPFEVRRNYGSQNPFDGAFGYGWKISMVPYLVVSTDSNNTLIYAAEMDGSVLTYRRQSPTSSTWAVSGTDNRQYINPQSYTPGTPNLLNNKITMTAGTSGTTYSLIGADGSLRTFAVQSFITAGGTNGLNLTRPYLQTWQDNRGNTLTFNYDNVSTDPSYGQVTSIKSSNGNYAGFQYDTFGHVTAAYTGDGNWTYYQYDDYGDLTQVTLPDNSIISYSYRHQPNVSTSGTGTGFYSEHLLTQENKPGGRVLQNYYDYLGFRRVIFQKSTVQQGNSTPIQSAAFSYVISATNNTPIVFSGTTYHTGTTLNLTGNTSGYTCSLTSGTGISITSSTLLSGSMPLPATAMLTGTTTMSDVNNNAWTYAYSNGNFTQINSPPQNNGSTAQSVTYAWYGPTAAIASGTYPCSLASYTDKRGLKSTYQYDAYGNVTQMVQSGSLTGASGTQTATTSMSYNTTAVTLPNSTVTAIPNTLNTVTDPIGNSVAYAYTNSAYPYLPTSITKAAPSGTVSTAMLQYGNASSGSGGSSANAYGLLQQETLASGSPYQAVTQFVYNGNGFPTQRTQVSETSDPNVVTYYNYNLRGQVTSETDSAGRNTQYQYDSRGNQTAELRYDENGNLVGWQFSYYNQNGEIEWTQGPRFAPDDYIQKEYDGAGRLATVSKYLIGAYTNGSGVANSGIATVFNTYNNFGSLTQTQDPKGIVTNMTYDAIGEMMTKQTPNTSGSYAADESFTYEPGGKVATHTTVLGGTENYAYTSTGLLMSGTMADGSTKSYLYDLTGRVVQETLANGSYWKRGYNDYTLTVTGTFFNSSGVQQGTESETSDPRGNVISKTDLGGNTFATTYDGLNRVKSVTGPPASSPGGAGATAQQSTSYTYDAGGLNQIAQNALGEKSVTSFDALERPIQVVVYNANGTVATNTRQIYSPNHQSVTTIHGGGTNGVAVSDTLYTDTYGNPILLQHADGSFQVTGYDANGNKTYFQDEQGNITRWTYDALNHLLSETLPADSGNTPATIGFSYNAAGELLSRQMPENLTEKKSYDSAGRETGEELDGTSGAVTRKFTSFTYYPSNSGTGAATGLLESVTDPRGFTTTTTYDPWMRPSTIASSGGTIAQQNQNTTYGYDIRGMVDSVSQSFVTGTAGPSTLVTRGYDGYGQMNQETTQVSGTTVSQWYQSWDGGGRRSALNWQVAPQGVGAGSQYGYSYSAAGQLTNVSNSGANYSYTYGDDGLLQQRSNSLWVKTISYDNRGRVNGDTVTGGGYILLSETSAYRFDSRLSGYSVLGAGSGAPNEARYYSFDGRGRVTWEPYVLGTGTSATGEGAAYGFDQTNPDLSLSAMASGLPTPAPAGTESGLNVRTEQYVTAGAGHLVNTQNGFGQTTQDDTLPGNGTYTPLNWQYDAAGNATQRSNPLSGGLTQTLKWDAWGRLVGISLSGTGGYTSTTAYDGFGRRVQTTWVPTSGTASTLTYYYDPQVEFLELGYNNNGGRQWKVYGPDKNGVYGGEQGIGGLDALVYESSGGILGEINNAFGDALGVAFYGTVYGIYGYYWEWWGSALGGYGALPGSGVDQANLTPQWRDRYLDWSGFYYSGNRYYEPTSGRFLSADPLGHDASLSLYDYCAGDPVDGVDPDGKSTLEVSGLTESFGPPVSQPTPMTLKQTLALTTFDVAATTGNYFSGNNWSQPASDEDVTAYQMFYEWDKGTGSSSRTFDENSTLGQQMLQSDYVQAGINTASADASDGNFATVPIGRTLNPPNLSEFQSLLNDAYYLFVDFPGDIGANPFMTPNPARGLQGSITGRVTPEFSISDLNGSTLIFMNVTLTDKLSATSATHGPPSFGGYNIPNISDPNGSSGPHRTIYTNYNMNVMVPVPAR